MIWQTIMVIFGTISNMYVAYLVGLRAGVFAVENYYMFSEMVDKPYTKTGSHGLGIIAAILYLQLLEFRKATKTPNHHFFRLISTSKLSAWACMLLGVALVIANAFVGFTAIRDPYSWSTWGNVCFFGFTRSTYVIGCFLVVFALFGGRFPILKRAFSNAYFNALGRLSFCVYLIHPIVIMMLYSGTARGLYLSVESVMAFGLGNILLSFTFAFVIYLLVEHPLKVGVHLVTRGILNPYGERSQERQKIISE